MTTLKVQYWNYNQNWSLDMTTISYLEFEHVSRKYGPICYRQSKADPLAEQS